MKRCSILTITVVLGIVFGGLGASRGMAQQSAADTNTRANLAKSEAAYVLAEFTDALNGKKLKPGTRIRADVAQDVLAHGKIIIPADARLVGHVTEVKTRGKEPASRLGIVFDKVLLKHHEEKNLQGVVYALAPPTPRRSKVDEPDQMMAPGYGISSGGRATPMGSRSSAPTRTSIMSADTSSAPVISAEPNTPAARIADLAPYRTPPISLGLPPGVYRMKGLSLSLGASADTPGPVILSTADDVKLEYGTQVIIKIADAQTLRP